MAKQVKDVPQLDPQKQYEMEATTAGKKHLRDEFSTDGATAQALILKGFARLKGESGI